MAVPSDTLHALIENKLARALAALGGALGGMASRDRRQALIQINVAKNSIAEASAIVTDMAEWQLMPQVRDVKVKLQSVMRRFYEVFPDHQR
jgi:hypothetical protein